VTGKRTTPVVIEDLEATAELPVIDYAPAAAKAPESSSSTDIYPVPAIPAGTSELADGLREAEHQLTRERRRALDLEAQLALAGERQTALDAQLTAAGERQAMLEVQLVEASEREAGLEARLGEARARHEALEAQMQMRSTAGQQVATARHRDAEFADLQRRCERQLEALTSWQGFRATCDAVIDELQARNAMLESQLARMSEALRALEGKPAAAAPRDVEKRALKSELAALKSELSALQAALASARERQQQSEQRADAEATRARRLETEYHTNVAVLDVPRKAAERPGRDETGNRTVVQVPSVDAPLRVLVRLEGGADVVYPIGRRTSIGRTSDNDIQIDAANVSRHHAVLLSGVEHCVVEDLNSTNGVLVNGQRVDRQVLRDGDVLRVGKVEFRFQQRS
jgi:predicted  nucleic acid-binding Zn-ribbon protein